MSHSSKSTLNLSDRKRLLVKSLLQKEGVSLSDSQKIPRRKDTDSLPLSFAQQRLWFLDQLEPNSPLYNLPSAVKIKGSLNVEAFRRTFNEIVRRHEVLRTSFAKVDGQPQQIISPPEPMKVPLIDLERLSEEKQKAEVSSLSEREAQRAFDLEQSPLLRVCLLKLGAEQHIALMTIHHIISDGWSMGVLVREVATLYEAFTKGEPSPLEELPIQYADFAVWQRRWMQGEALEAQLQYWRQHLTAAPAVLELPTDRPRPALQSHRGATFLLNLPRDLSEPLKALSVREGATLFMTLMAGFSTLLYRYSQQQDIVVGTPIAGRNHAEVESLIGFFVNLLVIRTRFTAENSFSEMIQTVKEVTLSAYANQDVPFEKLVDELQPERDMSHTPLFQVSLTVENTAKEEMKLPGLTLSPVDLENDFAKFDLTLVLTETQRGLQGQCEYSTDLFDGSTIARMMRHFQNLLESAVADPQQRIDRLALLTDAERRQLLEEWNDTARPYPAHQCLHHLFQQQAAQAPESLALVFDERSLTYGELNRRANQLAHHLQSLGVKPGSKVAVLIDRSIEMVIAVLGIVKAGGAYVPLDTDWPIERIHWILSSLEIDCALTQRSRLRAIHDLQWRLAKLTNVVLLDVDERRPEPEPLNPDSVRSLWDRLAEQATDRVSAGGFVSSYTGEAFLEAEVDEYVSRVVHLAEPHTGASKRALEIGCGAGLIMFELAPKVGSYVGLDPSDQTQARNRERITRNGHSNIDLLTGFADQIDSMPSGSFDLIIIASAAQFFPGPVYTERVIEKALELLSPGGVILLADIMDARRKDEFKRSLLEFKGRHAQARTKMQLDNELYFDEDFFTDLKAALHQIADVTALHREEGFDNELGFRYDVIIKKSGSGDAAAIAADRAERKKKLWTLHDLSRLSKENPCAAVTSDDVAYVIFTSGSTGVPKGVVIRHKAVVNIIDWVNRSHAVGPGDRLLFVTSLCFDLSVYDIFGVLASGAAIHIAAREALRDPQRLARMLIDHPITFWDSAPAALQQLAPFFSATVSSGGRDHLRLVFLSGDWIPLSLPDQVKAAFPQAQVVSLGGATEATIWSNFYPVHRIDPHWVSIPYGKPIQNAQYHVLDPYLNPCPVGVPGELHIGGECLALGYTDSEQTADRFIPNPFGKDAGARLYKTGDRARYRADGNIEFLGRVDHQLKIRGFRIELAEIEIVLSSHPAVRDAIVTACEQEPGDKRLVAYVVAKDGQAAGLQDLRGHLSERLPSYMVPTAFVFLDTIPLTSNGKVDRRALPAPDTSRPRLEAAYVAPRNEMERAIASIWQEALQVERVGIYDNFFDLGGYSLLVVRIHSKLQEVFKCKASITDLFAYPTISSLAKFLSSENGKPLSLEQSQDRGEARREAIKNLRQPGRRQRA